MFMNAIKSGLGGLGGGGGGGFGKAGNMTPPSIATSMNPLMQQAAAAPQPQAPGYTVPAFSVVNTRPSALGVPGGQPAGAPQGAPAPGVMGGTPNPKTGALIGPNMAGDPLGLEDQAGQAATQAYAQLRNYMPAITNTGLGSLYDIMASGGQIPNALQNQVLANISRGTQQLQDQATQQAAMAGPGMQQSGAAQAINAALGLAGQQQGAQQQAQFATEAATRQRQDIANLLYPYMQMALGGAPVKAQMQQQRWNQSNAKNQMAIGAVTGLVDAFMPL